MWQRIGLSRGRSCNWFNVIPQLLLLLDAAQPRPAGGAPDSGAWDRGLLGWPCPFFSANCLLVGWFKAAGLARPCCPSSTAGFSCSRSSRRCLSTLVGFVPESSGGDSQGDHRPNRTWRRPAVCFSPCCVLACLQLLNLPPSDPRARRRFARIGPGTRRPAAGQPTQASSRWASISVATPERRPSHLLGSPPQRGHPLVRCRFAFRCCCARPWGLLRPALMAYQAKRT